MNATELVEALRDFRIVPVIALEEEENAVPLGEALLEGGLPLAEITFRTAAAEASMRRLNRELPDILLGAGTVLTTEQVDTAIDAGASFIVTPGFNPRVVEHALNRGIPITPGINSPTGVELAMEYGLRLLKFFPAEVSGGVKMLKALGAPYKGVSFVPTGGVSLSNLESYLSMKNVAACGGSWLVPKDALAAQDFDQIRDITSDSCELASRIG